MSEESKEVLILNNLYNKIKEVRTSADDDQIFFTNKFIEALSEQLENIEKNDFKDSKKIDKLKQYCDLCEKVENINKEAQENKKLSDDEEYINNINNLNHFYLKVSGYLASSFNFIKDSYTSFINNIEILDNTEYDSSVIINSIMKDSENTNCNQLNVSIENACSVCQSLIEYENEVNELKQSMNKEQKDFVEEIHQGFRVEINEEIEQTDFYNIDNFKIFFQQLVKECNGIYQQINLLDQKAMKEFKKEFKEEISESCEYSQLI